MQIPSTDDITRGAAAFEQHEPRDAMYKVATFLVAHFWGRSAQMADALGVLLLTWNQAFYRYGSFSFDELETCITRNLPILEGFRQRDIYGFNSADESLVVHLFTDFLAALRIRKDQLPGNASPVAVSKAFHLLAPAFFPLWDQEIARSYGLNYSSHPEDKYVTFMRAMKVIAQTLDPVNLSRLREKTILKLIDECNYSHFTKSWI
jgi:hypothetical protein